MFCCRNVPLYCSLCFPVLSLLCPHEKMLQDLYQCKCDVMSYICQMCIFKKNQNKKKSVEGIVQY